MLEFERTSYDDLVLISNGKVFVFDGGAPLIKKIAISNRKNRKQGAKETAAKTAEKLLNAQLRAAAVAQAQKTALENETGDIVDENAVYMDDEYGIAPRGAPQRTRKRTPPPELDPASGAPLPKKKKYVHKDQYALPIIDGPISKNAKPSDPRLATEAELRSFIDEMRPEDFDMDSEFFSNLPIEVKYEIIGDLRIKSRQANFKRVEAMRNAPTALDFSKAQILGVANRNVLTQKLLSVTDSLSRIQPMAGSMGRIAGERNKEYVLIKNDASAGAGYILGVRDKASGTKASPVKIDTTTTEESDMDKTTTDEEFEQVAIPKPPSGHHRYSQSPDPELRRELALEAIKQRYSPVKQKTAQRGDSPVDELPALPPQKPLFRSKNGAEQPAAAPALSGQVADAGDALASFQPDFDLWDVLQQSVQTAEQDQQHVDEQDDLQRAIEQSRVEAQLQDIRQRARNGMPGPSHQREDDGDDGDESDVSFDEVDPSKRSPPKIKAAALPPVPESMPASEYTRDDSVEYVQVEAPSKAARKPADLGHSSTNGEIMVTIPRKAVVNPSDESLRTAVSTDSDQNAKAGPAPLLQPPARNGQVAGKPSKKPEGLHLDIPAAAYRPPSPDETNDSPPDQAVLEKQAERDRSPQMENERDDGIVERDYAPQPSSPPPPIRGRDTVSPPASSTQPAKLLQNQAAESRPIIPHVEIPESVVSKIAVKEERPSLMTRTLSGQPLQSPSPPPSANRAAQGSRKLSEKRPGPLVPNGSRADEAAVAEDKIAVADEGRDAVDAVEDLDKSELQEEVESGDVAGPALDQAAGTAAARPISPEVFFEWSPSPEPVSRKRADDPSLLPPDDPNYIPAELLVPGAGDELSDMEHDEDEEQVANLTSEQREYAKFLSELKNKNLDEMEYEVQNELRVLNEQNKRDRKLADDITQQMAKDIQVSLLAGTPEAVELMGVVMHCSSC